MRLLLALAILASTALACGTGRASDLQGVWQGQTKLVIDQKFVFKFGAPGDAGTLIYDEDWGTPRRVSGLARDGNKIKFFAAGGIYEGELSQDGNALTGTWTTNKIPFPLKLERVPPGSEWKESPHKVQRIVVDRGVELEVLDWGGRGRPLVLLSGLGNSAHKFDGFAQKLVGDYHVYGVTRRGYGASSAPLAPAFEATRTGDNTYEIRPSKTVENPYDADRLGDDVIKVLDALKLSRPVLAGHSIAGEELTSIGLRYPKRVAGLIYLDAFYAYAYADGVSYINLVTEQHPLKVTVPPGGNLPSGPGNAVTMGTHEYSATIVPSLAICASPRLTPPFTDPAAITRFQADDKVNADRYDRIAPVLPKVRFVRIAQADHYIFQSNEADVLREMKAFIVSLPK